MFQHNDHRQAAEFPESQCFYAQRIFIQFYSWFIQLHASFFTIYNAPNISTVGKDHDLVLSEISLCVLCSVFYSVQRGRV